MDKKIPKISVIIPVYNTEKYIEKCLDSIKNQIMKDLEIIIVNDGSNDNSEQVIKKWINENKEKVNVKYFKKSNGGLSDARNYGVTKASGEYISFIDSDDYIEKDLYKSLENYMEKNIDLIKFKMTGVDGKGTKINKYEGPVFENCKGEEAFEKLCVDDKNLEVACTYLYRKEFFIKNKFTYKKGAYHEDFGLTPLIIIKAKSVVSVENYGYYYLQRENSITSEDDDEKEKKKAYDVLTYYDDVIRKIEKENVSKKTKILIKRYYTNALLLKAYNLKGNDLEEYLKELKERKIYKNIKSYNFKQLIKKIILKMNIKLYLKIR